MSMSPEDRVVTLLSRWLARHLDNEQLRAKVEAAGREGLSVEQAQAVEELLAGLAASARTARGALEPLVRETMEALVLG
jgi:hypothetical protein